jgi:hypothetical protein
MFCTQCGAELPDGSQFCSKCGQALTAVPKPETSAFKTGRAAGRRPFFAIVLVGLGIILLLVFARILVHRNSMPLLKRMATAQVPPQARKEIITNTAFTVKADSYLYYKFTVPPNATNVWVDGNFNARGGSGNDIEAYLYDEDAFVNWQNNRSVRAYYNSGRSTQGKIYAGLPPRAGTYYLVFNNNFSLITPKAVRASATLHYTN